ncbi:MAG: CHASE3 domain-containing protein [Scytolyngbya sp. HA4215-MV1]|jgi:PAS domain S-box-containing protein|nr:CHASE3 domain-containing protein [Scytolyngbya sp. HA4215-MV1]
MQLPVLSYFNTLWTRLSVRRKGAIVIAIPAFCLMTTLGSWVWSRQVLLTIRQKIDNTQEILVESNVLLLELLNAETGVRGYSITQDSRYLEPYNHAVAALPGALSRLKIQINGSSQQMNDIQALEQLIQQNMATLALAIQTVKRQSELDQTSTLPMDIDRLLYLGKGTMDKTREVISSLQARNRQLYLAYNQQQQDNTQFTSVALWFTGCISLLGSLAAMYLFSSLDQELTSRERLLLESKTLMSAIVSTVVDGVIILDDEGKIEIFNPTAVKMFAYEPEEVIGQQLDFLLAEPLVQKVKGTEITASLPLRPGRPWKTKGARKIGTPFPIEISISEMHLDNQMIVIVRDISAFIEAEEKLQSRANELVRLSSILARTNAALEDRNQELEQFAYVTSHDLKAPLRAIANLSEWIEEDLEGYLGEESQQHMRLLRGRVHRMEALINGLLEYSRVGRTQATIEQVDVAVLIEEVIESLDPPSTFTIVVAEQMPTLMTKQLLLRQVLSNLLSNAIKHHDRPDGRIEITVQDQEKFYEFVVKDNGPGIAPVYHDKIFVIFQTLQARDTKENTGVGLAIVKRIVEAEGGNIWLDSQEDRGASFHFTWLKHPMP